MSKIEFKRDRKTGILSAYKNGKAISKIIAMGDKVKKK